LDAVLSGHAITHLPDRKLLTQLVYGTLRMRGYLDWIISRLYTGAAGSLETRLENILRTALFQILCMDRIPPYAAVNEAVEIAKKEAPGREPLVNAILRNALRKKSAFDYPSLKRDPALHISVVYSHPLWLVKKWIESFGVEESIKICTANNEIPPLTIRVNTLKTTREELRKELAKEDFHAEPATFSPDGLILSAFSGPIRRLPCFEAGKIHLQDEASQLVSYLVNPKPGEKILDLCSGMGVKTTHLAERMANKGAILAMDNNRKKTISLMENARRMGSSIIEAITGDATVLPAEKYRGRFDRVLVDAPCSGLGTLRRNPEIKWHLTMTRLKTFPALQLKLLESAVAYLKPGGNLIYSTCTMTAEENDRVIKAFLVNHTDFHLKHPPPAIPQNMIDHRGFFRTYPHRHGSDGFFGAILARK
jgi:16S rRNA (cytosine967-C5)-methyltransferase